MMMSRQEKLPNLFIESAFYSIGGGVATINMCRAIEKKKKKKL